MEFLKTTAMGGIFVLLPVLLLYLLLSEALNLIVALVSPIADLFPEGTFDKVEFPVMVGLILILAVSFFLLKSNTKYEFLQRIQPMTQTAASRNEQPRAGWRFRLGLTTLIVGWLSPLLIPVVTRTSLATEWKTILSGLLAVGIPEVFTVAAIAIMGKEGYNLIKKRIFSFLKKHGPPDRVSLARYRIGLVMFVLPVVFGWLGPYGAHRIPGYETHRFAASMIGDVMFAASLFVLGGNFWDKVRSLFIYNAKAQIPVQNLT